jgi:anti-sigma B factor antagonist
MSILEIRHERDATAGDEVVAPQGEIDISNQKILDEVLADALQRQPRRLVIDLAGVIYLDSAGVSSLLRAGHRLAQQGGQLALVGGERFTRRLLQMTGIDRIFPYYDTLEAALGSPPSVETSTDPDSSSAVGPRRKSTTNDRSVEPERIDSEVGAESCGAALSAS